MSSHRRRGQRFDAEANVVTESLIFLGELDPEPIGDAIADATHYEPTPMGDFETLLAAVPDKLESFTLLDAGAGMGRVLLLASKYPFKQIAGVEVSPALCEVARDNVVRWLRTQSVACRDIRVKCGDALHVKLPAGPLVVYLFNPFGETSLEAFAQRLISECAAPVYVLYHTPVARRVFDDNRSFALVAETAAGVVYQALPSMPRSF